MRLREAWAATPRRSIRKAAEGPVEPLDLPELPDMPINIGDTNVRIDENKGVTVTTDVGGVPLDVTLGRDGIAVKPGNRENRR